LTSPQVCRAGKQATDSFVWNVVIDCDSAHYHAVLSTTCMASNAQISTMRAHMHDSFHDSKVSLRVTTGLTG